LVAYVVVSSEIDGYDLKEDICNYVGKYKPDYMLPSFVISLDNIPLTVNGKVDVGALPDVDLNSLRSDYVAPTNETEKHIIESFEVVFNQKDLGLYDDFVRLGGDSINAIRVISLLEKNNIFCSARDILNYKTPYLIAQNVEKVIRKSYDPTEGEVSLLPIQSYFFDQINNDGYSQNFILKSKIDLDLDTLQYAFNELFNIHDLLRSSYKYKDDRIVQEILPVNTRICKIKEYTADDLKNTILNVVNEFRETLDIEDNLINVGLVHYCDESFVVFVIHHLIIDGVSWSILIDDLTYILTQIKENNEINLSRPYPYKYWVDDVKSLVKDISDEEKEHWIGINALLDDSSIKGNSKGFSFDVGVKFNADNPLMLSEEEYWALAISRAYKKTYNEDIIFNRESYGRDESLADVSRTIGWFTSQFPVLVDVNNGHDDIGIMNDVYTIKKAFKGVNHLGLNYGSLIYYTNELEYKYCPVTFNFLSTEFSFENEMFESINIQKSSVDKLKFVDLDSDSYGISLNVYRVGEYYFVNGDYADDTSLGDKFLDFVENIKYELEFIGSYGSNNESLLCCLSESQLGIYLDEMVNDMGTAYSGYGAFDCGVEKSVAEIKNAILSLIDKHPILKGRVVDGDTPLLVCDVCPSIEVIGPEDYSDLIRPFDLNESLARFYIIENDNGKFIFYDLHHIINDASCHPIINKDLSLALSGELGGDVDLGFVHASSDSFESKFENSYEEAHLFFKNNLSVIDDAGILLDDVGGVNNCIKLPIRGVRDDVEAFCREYGITVGNFLNAIFAYTFSRFTGSDLVYYNFTEHGRHEDYAKDALGMFVRTVPLIVDCKNTSVKEFLSNVSNLILDSIRYSVYPFRLLANEFNLNKNIGFEYNFDLNDVSNIISDELIIEDKSIGLISDFLCVVNDLEDGYLVNVDSCSKYSDNLIIRFLNAFKEILIEALNKDNLSDINYVLDSDVELLDSFNETENPLDYADVLDAFNDNLSNNPDNMLISYKDNSYTYCEGAFIAYEIAQKLIDLGVESQDCVGFLVPRSELYMFSVLGILSVGGVYVPLDDNLPDERLSFILNDVDSKLVIVNDKTYERAKALTNDVALLNISDIIKGEIGKLSSLPVNYGNLACILYTSGTTGVPKGVKVTRKSILNLSEYYRDSCGFNEDDVYGLFASISFDAASQAICQTVYAGASLSIVPDEIKLDIYKMNNYFIKHEVTHTMITTQVGKLFIENIADTSIKVLTVGGEKLGEFENSNKYQVIDAFGPTETFAFITSINNLDKIDYSSIGVLNYNTKAYILDDEFRRTPVGAVGELYLAGYQIADGYLNREDETKTAFMDNPFDNSKDYNVLYRTGDMVRVLSDGSLAIVGRRDSQVKIRGNRVELIEVESLIREIDYVDDVTVQTVKNDENNELVAYVVISNDLDDEKLFDSIRDYVSIHKPEYMIPSFVICLDEIPVNINAKVDINALPNIELSDLKSEYAAPTSEFEKIIVTAFEKVFNKEKISIYDDFIRLGGDSISAIKVMAFLSEKSIDIDARNIFKNRTPYNIAKYLEKDDVEYSCTLAKKGTVDQNMFVLPPKGGLSFIFNKFVNEINFKGNIYLLDDFRYDLPLEEISNYSDCNLTLKYYYEAINDIFKDGDIIVGYSLGCIYASLITEKLEKSKTVGKCILIDGVLIFDNDESESDDKNEHIDVTNTDYPKELIEKFILIDSINSKWSFNTPNIKSQVIYLSTDNDKKDYLDDISSNYKFIIIDDTNHLDIIDKDLNKILKYF
ncbi:condensation domain-containing protein, partial [Methanobrevibacter sp.]|uniref:condensation domain-containing protein n=1 Tax=Methanobrevibacter sp. TaxID=66852 RepID=UPI003890CE95